MEEMLVGCDSLFHHHGFALLVMVVKLVVGGLLKEEGMTAVHILGVVGKGGLHFIFMAAFFLLLAVHVHCLRN